MKLFKEILCKQCEKEPIKMGVELCDSCKEKQGNNVVSFAQYMRVNHE